MNAVMSIYDFQHLFFRLGNFRVQHLFYTVHASLDGKTSDRTAILALVGCHQLLTLFYKHFSVACQLTKLIQSLFRELPVFQLIRISLAKFSEQCAIQDIRLGTVRGSSVSMDDISTHKGNLHIAIHAALQESITINSGMLSNQYSIAWKGF